MSKETAIFLLGMVVFFNSFLGIPTEYKEWILIIVGLLIIVIGYRLRREAFLQSIESESGERADEMFVENNASEKGGEEQDNEKRFI